MSEFDYVHNFMLDRTALSSPMYISVSFDGSIVTTSVDRSTHFRLDVLVPLCLLQYRYWRKPKETETSRWKHGLLSMLIVTIDPSKATEKYIADDEAVWSNTKLLYSSDLNVPAFFWQKILPTFPPDAALIIRAKVKCAVALEAFIVCTLEPQ